MNTNRKETMMMHLIENAEFEKDFVLNVTWKNGAQDTINLVGLIERSRHFKRFLGQADEFQFVEVVENGIGIEWDNGLDYSAESLWRMAELQRPVSKGFFSGWQSGLEISNQEAADMLGVSLATVKKYRHGSPVPRPTVLACKSILENKDAVFALYRPRHTGRPVINHN